MRFPLLASLLLATGLLTADLARADTLAYPTTEKTSFLIDYPSDWTLEQAESEGDYMTLTAPTQTILQFRTIEGTEETLKQAVVESYDYIKESYTKVELGEPKEVQQHGLRGLIAGGTGHEAEVGDVNFGVAWLELKDGTIGEIWYVAAVEDTEGRAAAVDIMNSFRAP